MQYDFGTIDPTITSGAALANEIQSHRDAVISSHSGAGRPSYAVPGTIWVGTAGSVLTLYLYTGTVDAPIGTINPTTGVLTSADPADFTRLINKPTTYAAWATAILAPSWIVKDDPSPVGEVKMVLDTVAPTGFIKLNGAAVNRTTYSALFAKFGTTYGAGNGSTTFNVPDFRGLFPRALDDGRGIDPGRALGVFQAMGLLDHLHSASSSSSTTIAAAGSHAHNVIGKNNAASYGGPGVNYNNVGYDAVQNIMSTDTQGNHAHGATTTTSTSIGGVDRSASSENRPQNISALFVVRY